MPSSAYSDPPTFTPLQTLTAAQQNALGDAIRSMYWWTAAGSLPYAYDADQLEELLAPARASLLTHDASIPAWLTVAAAGADKYKNVRVNSAGTAFELAAGGVKATYHNDATGHSYGTNAWRDMPNSSKIITVDVTSTIVVVGWVREYQGGTESFFWKFNIDGTDIDWAVAGRTYDANEINTIPNVGLKASVAPGSRTIKIRELASFGNPYDVEMLAYVILVIPE